jgi:hypothetical protein
MTPATPSTGNKNKQQPKNKPKKKRRSGISRIRREKRRTVQEDKDELLPSQQKTPEKERRRSSPKLPFLFTAETTSSPLALLFKSPPACMEIDANELSPKLLLVAKTLFATRKSPPASAWQQSLLVLQALQIMQTK